MRNTFYYVLVHAANSESAENALCQSIQILLYAIKMQAWFATSILRKASLIIDIEK